MQTVNVEVPLNLKECTGMPPITTTIIRKGANTESARLHRHPRCRYTELLKRGESESFLEGVVTGQEGIMAIIHELLLGWFGTVENYFFYHYLNKKFVQKLNPDF